MGGGRTGLWFRVPVSNCDKLRKENRFESPREVVRGSLAIGPT